MNNINKTNILFILACILSVVFVFVLFKRDQNLAVASGVASGDGFSMLSVSNGAGTEFLYVIDDKTGMLMVYSIPDPQNRKFIQPEASWLLPALFNSVRN